MKPFVSNAFNGFKNYMYKHYGENPGKMLVHTGVLGWLLSSIAQITAIITNDNISKEQKAFLVPQEMWDAFVNIGSFYLVTSSITKLASKLVTTGKLTSPKIKKFAESKLHPTDKNLGDFDFDIRKLPDFDSEISTDFKKFKNGVDITASIIGSVLSSNIVTPVIRNIIASKRQKSIIDRMNLNNHRQDTVIYPKRPTMNEYLMLTSGTNLKI